MGLRLNGAAVSWQSIRDGGLAGLAIGANLFSCAIGCLFLVGLAVVAAWGLTMLGRVVVGGG